MNKHGNKSLIHEIGKRAIPALVRHEYEDWPPESPFHFYQPHRPEKRPGKFEKKSNDKSL